MSRYKRKSERKLVFTEENLQEAKQKISEGISKRQVAADLGIGESTLRKRLKCGGNVPVSLGRFRKVFSDDMEVELASQVRELDQRFYGITKKNLQIAAYKFAEANNITHTFNTNKKMAGDSWIAGFCKRNNIVLRQPENCSLGRIMGFNKPQVERFFANLKSLYEKRKYTADSIFNMDETGLTTVPNKLPKVLATKGKKLVGKVASAERGQLITAVCCVSASGNYIPPALVFPRKRMNEDLFLNAPPGTLQLISDSGFINTDLFYQWIIHFKHFSNPTAEHPILLVLDNHSSHRDLRVIQYCRDNHIDLLSLPPHSSHRMQPLDIGFFGPLKRAYIVECDNWMVSHPGKGITQKQVASLFNAAYAKVANIEKAQNSFRKAGIFPYDPRQFSDEDFAPSSVTDIPLQETATEDVVSDDIQSQMDTTEVNETSKLDSFTEISAEVSTTSEPGCSSAIFERSVVEMTPPPHSPKNNVSLDILNLDILCEDGAVIKSQTIQEQNNEKVVVKAAEIIPFPCIQQEQHRRRNRSQKSEILSSSPFTRELETSIQEKKSKEENKKAKAVKRNLNKTAASAKRIQKKSETNQIIKCPGCSERYTDPPTEDWIMCCQCENWWHESCTTYVEGNFICFNC